MGVISYSIFVILSALLLISTAYTLYLWPKSLVDSAVEPEDQ